MHGVIPHLVPHQNSYESMVKLVREASQQGKVVAAICHAGWMLASAGVLKGKKATSFFAIKDDVANAGATWVDQEVVVDGNLITSRKPDDIPAFCREIVKALVEGKRCCLDLSFQLP